MPKKNKTKPKLPESLEKTSADHRDSAGGMRYLFFRRKNLPSNNTKESNNQKSEDPTQLLEKDNVNLEKKCICKMASVKVEMGHLPDFLEIDIVAAIRPKIILKCLGDIQQQYKKLKKNCLKALARFFSYLNYVYSLKIRECDALKKEHLEFVNICKRNIELFEKFFPLPEKYKLFANELLKIIDEDENIKDNLALKYNVFIKILEESDDKDCGCIFERPDLFLSVLKNADLSFYFTNTPHPNAQQIEIYKSFEAKLIKLLQYINTAKTKKDEQNIKNKMKAFVESTFSRNSIAGKKSFLDTMKKKIAKYSDLKLKKLNIERTRNIWAEIRECMVENTHVEASNIFVNGNHIKKKYLPAAAEFLGSIVEEKERLLIGKWDSAKLPNNSKIRQCLVVNALTNLVAHDHFRCGVQYSNEERLGNLENLKHSFSQLTKKERIAVMCAEVKHEDKVFPLLPLFFLNHRDMSFLIDIIKDFVPEVFDIRFQINAAKKECDIIELLEKMNNFCKKFEDEDVNKEEGVIYDFECLDLSIDELKKIKEKINSPENKAQELQALQEEPSTSMCQVEKEKMKQEPQCISCL